jgi:lipid II:glycine glycyltransferase (peptidoglycan interpeptide bridge formation enzyme)
VASIEPMHKAAVPLLWQLISDASTLVLIFDFWGIAPTDDPDHKRADYTRFKRSFGGQVKA